jgi:hypothetical protein
MGMCVSVKFVLEALMDGQEKNGFYVDYNVHEEQKKYRMSALFLRTLLSETQ